MASKLKTTVNQVEHKGSPHIWQKLFLNEILWGPMKQEFSKTNTAFHKNNIKPKVKYGGGSVIVWGSFPALGPGQLSIITELPGGTHPRD